MNAHIESLHAILERDYYNINEFNSFINVYEVVSKYINYYNKRYRHGSRGDISPTDF